VDRVHDRCEPAALSGPRWTTTGADKRAQRCLIDVRRASARAHRSSPVVAKVDEDNEAVTEGCLPEDEQWRDDDEER
jgi:hypothetical protein